MHSPATEEPNLAMRYQCPEPGQGNIYFLGTEETRLSIADQQIRAFNLAKMLASDRLRRVAIIGGGISGLTFAAGLLLRRRDLQIDIFERASDLLPVQTDSPRVVVPNGLEWPLARFAEPRTSLPYMNWTRGPASTVAKVLKEQVRALVAATGAVQEPQTDGTKKSNVSVRTQHKVNLVEQADELINVHYYGPLGTDLAQGFDACVVCTGYVESAIVYPHAVSRSYWDCHRLSASEGKPPKLLVCGVGDGGLIEVVHQATGRYPIELAVALWPDTAGIPDADICAEIDKLEQLFRSQDKQLHANSRIQRENRLSTFIKSEYGKIEWLTRMSTKLRGMFVPVRDVSVSAPFDTPFSLRACALHRMMLFLLMKAGIVKEYYKMDRQFEYGDNYFIKSDDGSLHTLCVGDSKIPIDYVIERYGPQKRPDKLLGRKLPSGLEMYSPAKATWLDEDFVAPDGPGVSLAVAASNGVMWYPNSAGTVFTVAGQV